MEAAPTPSSGTTLPLALRLRRALLIAFLLGLWGPCKIVWEQRIAQEQNLLLYNGAPINRQLRDQLSQGLTIGVLSGMRSVVADLLWLNVVTAWMNQDWYKMGGYINSCTALQPRTPVFWVMGGWQLAYNASVAASMDPTLTTDLRRLKASRYWIDQGLDVYLRGIQNNPDYWRLWSETAQLYDQRLHNYTLAAHYYQRASELPDAPVYLERFAAHMYDSHHANDPQAEYAQWVSLWNRLSPEQRQSRLHDPDHQLEWEIRRLEAKLSIPREKRVFPN